MEKIFIVKKTKFAHMTLIKLFVIIVMQMIYNKTFN